MPRYCHNPPLGTTPNAKIRIRTPYAAAPCGSVAKIARKDVENATPRRWRTSGRFFAYFGTRVLYLVCCSSADKRYVAPRRQTSSILWTTSQSLKAYFHQAR